MRRELATVSLRNLSSSLLHQRRSRRFRQHAATRVSWFITDIYRFSYRQLRCGELVES